MSTLMHLHLTKKDIHVNAYTDAVDNREYQVIQLNAGDDSLALFVTKDQQKLIADALHVKQESTPAASNTLLREILEYWYVDPTLDDIRELRDMLTLPTSVYETTLRQYINDIEEDYRCYGTCPECGGQMLEDTDPNFGTYTRCPSCS